MKLILTNDGTYTLHSSRFDETYHSVSGAIEEAFEKYVNVCNLKPGSKILDFCFGLGYNSLAAIYKLKKVEIIGLEIDRDLLNSLDKVKVPGYLEKDYEKIRIAGKNLSYKDANVSIKLVVGNAIKTITNLPKGFDAVFFDPFSPKKSPELWTKDVFSILRTKMKANGVLATYSCAKKVRLALIAAGFKVKDGPSVGRRSPSTIAFC